MTDQQALREYATSRDAQAFRILVEAYQRLVYSAASRKLNNAQDIEDVVQITFLKLAKTAGEIRRDLAGWLYATTIHTANDLIRRDRTRRRHEALAAPAESSMLDAQKEDWRELSLLVDEAILELPKAQQLLIVEHFFRGRSQRDLAQEFNVSQPTVLRRINAAVDELRKHLAKRGYSVTPLLLASALVKIPQPCVPATLTAELAKVGLSGVVTGSSGTSKVSGLALWIKFGLGAIAAIALAASAAFLLPPISTTKPASAAVTPATIQPAADPADWRTAFNEAYSLQPGQNLKFIPPPPLAERQRYLLEVEHNDSPMPFIQWRWIHGKLKREMMQGGGPSGASLSSVMLSCAKLDAYHISLDAIPPIDADGDWIVRDGAATEAILADLRTILLNQWKINVSFEKSEVAKDALIVNGQYNLRRIPDATLGDLQIYCDVLDHPQPGESIAGGGTTPPAELWTLLGGYIGIPIIDESANEPAKISWALSRSIQNANEEAGRVQILDNITKQTGLSFRSEKRIFAVWKATPAANQDAISIHPSR